MIFRYIISRSHPQASLETENEGNASCWKVLHDRILACCDVLWESVRDVLCMDSPEGHTVEDVEDDVDIGEKDTLSFSWRALKESR